MAQEHRTKHDIREAARRLFAARGYDSVSMRDIAQEVGKHQGGIYNHFSSKQALLVDLMQDNLRRASDAAIAPLGVLRSPKERLEAFVRGHLQHTVENPDDIFIAYMELRSLEAEGGATVLAQRDAYEGALRAILADGQAAGHFNVLDPAIHTRTILSMLSGVIVWYRESGAQSLEDVTECYVQAALQSVGVAYTPPKS